jgi:hypothetical protein
MITGERIQELCDIYLGLPEDFAFNPRIQPQKTKQKNLLALTESWDNPRTLFCHGHRLPLLIDKLPFLQNPFVLVSHNSDEQIIDKYRIIADHPSLIAWYAQNVLFEHPKLHWIPIGIANSMWEHGALAVFKRPLPTTKSKDIYFFFNAGSNRAEREPCRQAVQQKGLSFGCGLPFQAYIGELAAHKYAICPPGNGVDCHRFWECFYLGVIPILKRSYFTEQVAKQFQCILLDNWSDLSIETLLREYRSPPSYSRLTIEHLKESFGKTSQIMY